MTVPKKIVVVEDEPPLQLMVKERLQSEGFFVVSAFDGQTALDLVEKYNPDLIILDILLPRIDGFEVLKRLKENRKTAKIPVIVLTALSQPKDIEKGIGLYAEKYLIKPFKPAVLIEEVKKTLSIL